MNRTASWMVALVGIVLTSTAGAATVDWGPVDQAFGRKGVDLPGAVHKYALPRSDLNVTVDGITLKPALALGGWVAFEPAGATTTFMGDLVLTDAELNPVLSRLLAGGIEVTAIHNHLLRTSAPVFYMHIGGHGDAVKVAATLRAALALSSAPLTQLPPAQAAPLDLDTAAVDQALGSRGTVNGGVYQFSIPRAETITEGGMTVPPSMGTAIPLNFQPTGAGKAAITGDFVLLQNEVQPVLKSLREHGIEVTALHSHMIDDSPHLYFMHFWANDDAVKLARELHAALELVNVKSGS